MLVWEDGSPNREGLCVVEWMNLGGFAVYDIRAFDGILFAFTVATAADAQCTRLDKWAIRRHVFLPNPYMEVLETMFSRGPEAKQRAAESH